MCDTSQLDKAKRLVWLSVRELQGHGGDPGSGSGECSLAVSCYGGVARYPSCFKNTNSLLRKRMLIFKTDLGE